MDAEATTEADSGSCDRSAAERRLGRAGDRAGAWPLAQRDQYRDRARTGRQLRRRLSAGRGGGRRARLAPDSPLIAEVTKLLRLQWSPEQIAGRRKRMEDGVAVSSGVPVSHEAIYQAIYAVPRGVLLACLCQSKPRRGRRTGRADLRHHPRTAGGGGGMPGAGTLGGRSDHGDRQLLLGRHAGPAASWSSWRTPKPR